MRMQDMIAAIVFGSVLVLGVWIALAIWVAKKFAEIAQSKGYDYDTYFHWSFWLGVVGWCMVAALPDNVVRDRLFSLQNGEKTSSGSRSSTSKSQVVLKASADDYSMNSRTSAAAGSWTCSCGKVNAGYVSSCVCGKTKKEAQNNK